MPIETPLAKKVTRFQNSNDCFLAPFGNDGELDLALLDVKNRVRNVTLPSCSFSQAPFSHTKSVKSVNHIAIPTPK
jgi:hypothetical protein